MTALSVCTSPTASLPADCIVIGVAKGPNGPASGAAAAEAFDGTPAELLGALGVTVPRGKAAKLPRPPASRPGWSSRSASAQETLE